MPKLYESITLQPRVLRWARERAGLEREQLAANLKLQIQDIEGWEHSGRITFNEVDDLAKHIYTPVGYLYLSEPPDDSLPIADFRTRTGVLPQRPSPNLLDTVYQMQLRQAWMREEMISQEDPPLALPSPLHGPAGAGRRPGSGPACSALTTTRRRSGTSGTRSRRRATSPS